MLLIFKFHDFDVDVLDVPEFVITDIKKIQKQFDKWLYDKDNPKTWHRDVGAFCFRGDMFVHWLNEYLLKDSKVKAKILESQAEDSDYDPDLLRLYY